MPTGELQEPGGTRALAQAGLARPSQVRLVPCAPAGTQGHPALTQLCPAQPAAAPSPACFGHLSREGAKREESPAVLCILGLPRALLARSLCPGLSLSSPWALPDHLGCA